MKIISIILSLSIGMFLLANFTIAEETSLSVGGKLWYADFNPGIEVDDVEPGILWGPIISLDFKNNFWVSSMFLTGELTVKRSEDLKEEIEKRDAEVIVGYSWDIFDIGTGIRYSKWVSELGATDYVTDMYGPMVYFGMGNTLGQMPIGWYASTSWMFADFNDEAKEPNHINLEGGVFFTVAQFTGALGYRYKTYYNHEEDFDFQGVTINLGVSLPQL